MENHNFGTGCNTNSAELFKESLKRVAEMERRFIPQKGIVPTCDSMCAEANKIMYTGKYGEGDAQCVRKSGFRSPTLC